VQNSIPLNSIDYLVVGNLTCDLTPSGPRLGGTAAYSGLTGKALGLRVGIVSAWGGEVPLDVLEGIQVWSINTEHSATFENKYHPGGRIQILHHAAPDLRIENIPMEWRSTPLVHIGPIAGEGKTLAAGHFPNSMLGFTPQGWLRTWNGDGHVRPCVWPEALQVLPGAAAAVISVEDVNGDEEQIEAMAAACPILAVTEGPSGARLYWNGDLRRFQAPIIQEVDATGAGDIFATAFLWRLFSTRDPWAAARFATHLASFSVMRSGLDGIPTREEIQTCLVEVM
jgi:sugar/nucleoside kinase (ribokinase family)